MTDSQQELEDRLRRVLDHAARHLPVRAVDWQDPPSARRERGMPALGSIATLLAAATAIAIAVLALVVLKHGSSGHPSASQPGASPHHGRAQPPAGYGPLLPPHPSRRQRQDLHYLTRAMSTAARDYPACARQPSSRPSSGVREGAPSPALLAILGVLRRPAKPTDALPGRRLPAEEILARARGIYVHSIRRARVRDGIGYYIAPVANANPLSAIPARCYAEQRTALRRELPRAPKRLRAPILALEPRFVDQQRYDLRPQPGVCLLALRKQGAGGISCNLTISTIKRGSVGTFQGQPSAGGGVIYGVVPDGVATVTLYLPGRVVTGRVTANVYIVRYPGRLLNGFQHLTIWRSANSKIIKTIHNP